MPEVRFRFGRRLEDAAETGEVEERPTPAVGESDGPRVQYRFGEPLPVRPRPQAEPAAVEEPEPPARPEVQHREEPPPMASTAVPSELGDSRPRPPLRLLSSRSGAVAPLPAHAPASVPVDPEHAARTHAEPALPVRAQPHGTIGPYEPTGLAWLKERIVNPVLSEVVRQVTRIAGGVQSVASAMYVPDEVLDPPELPPERQAALDRVRQAIGADQRHLPGAAPAVARGAHDYLAPLPKSAVALAETLRRGAPAVERDLPTLEGSLVERLTEDPVGAVLDIGLRTGVQGLAYYIGRGPELVLSSVGSTFNNLTDAGVPADDARKAAIAAGAVSAALERVPMERLLRGPESARRIRDVLQWGATQAVAEGGTEFAQEFPEVFAEMAVGVHEERLTWDDVMRALEAGAEGAIGGLLLGGGRAGAEHVRERRQEAREVGAAARVPTALERRAADAYSLNPQPSGREEVVPTDPPASGSDPAIEPRKEVMPRAEAPPASPTERGGALTPEESSAVRENLAGLRQLGQFSGRPGLPAAPPRKALPEAASMAEEAATTTVTAERAAVPPAESSGEATADPEPERGRHRGYALRQAYADPRQLVLRPEEMQFKLSRDARGVTGSLAGVSKWDPHLAGSVTVWEDPASGEWVVVNGHNRVARAQDLGVPELQVTFVRASSAKEARAIGALQNIAEGHGTAVDAGKFFRDSGISLEDARDRYGLPMSEKKVRDGLALAGLSDWLFNQVARGEFPVERGAIIGEALPAQEDQQRQLVKLIDKAAKGGRRMTNEVVRELADLVAGAPTVETTQESLFGADTVTESYAIEKAEVMAYIREKLAREKRLLGLAAKAVNVEELERHGNTIRAEENRQASEDAARVLAAFDAWKRYTEFSAPLNQAAVALAEGQGSPKLVKERAYRQVRELIDRAFKGTVRPGAAGESSRTESEQDDGSQGSIFGYREAPTRRDPWQYAEEGWRDWQARQMTPDVAKLWRRLALMTHPDRGTDEADRKRRELFIQEANAAADRNDLHHLRLILESWQREDIAPPRWRGRRLGGYTPGTPKGGSTSPPPEGNPRPRAPRSPQEPEPKPRDGKRRARPEPKEETRDETDDDPGPPPGDAARGSATYRGPKRLALNLPEVVEIARGLGKGKYPKVRRYLGPGVRGRFVWDEQGRQGRVEVRADLPKDPEAAAQVLAHEIGHWIDAAPRDSTMARGNILGSLGSLKRYVVTLLDAMPTDPSKVFGRTERVEWWRAAWKKAREEHPPQGRASAAERREKVKERAERLYQQKLQEEIRRRGLVDKKTVTDELWELSQRWRGPVEEDAPPKYVAYRRHPRELYADFLSALLNDPDFTAEAAPTAFAVWNNYLVVKPEVLELYARIQERIALGEAARTEHLADQVEAMMRAGAADRAQRLARWYRELENRDAADLVHAVTEGLIDTHSPLYEYRKKARRAGRSIDPEKDPVHFLEEMMYAHSEVQAYTHTFQETVLDPLRAAGVDQATASAILALLRTEGERAALWNPLGVGGELAGKVRRQIERRLGAKRAEVVAEVARRWWELRQWVIEEVRESGIAGPELLQKIESNPFYVRFQSREVLQEPGWSEIAGPVFHRQVGTLGEIGDVLVETLLTDMRILRLAHVNRTSQAVVGFFKDNFPQEIRAARRLGRSFERPGSPGLSTLKLIEDGKAVAYHLPKRVVEAVERDLEFGGAYRFWQKIVHTPLRVLLVERNPGWWVWNLQRDARDFAKRVVKGDPFTAAIKALYYVAKSLPEALRLVFRDTWSDDVRAMYRGKMMVPAGMRLSQASQMDQADAMAWVLRRAGIGPHWEQDPRWQRNLRRFLRWTLVPLLFSKKPGEVSERVVKIAGYKYLRDHRKELGLSEREIAHVVRTQVGTPDVLRRGRWHGLTNTLFLFSNVNKEGWRASAEAFRRRPWEYFFKTLTYDLIPKVAMFAAAHGWMGEEWEEWFKRLSSYYKRLYTVIPLGYDANGKAVFIPLPQDHTGQLLGALTWAVLEAEWDDLAGAIMSEFPYSPAKLHPAWVAITKSLDLMGGRNPIDDYRDQPIIPERTFKAYGPYHRKSLAAYTKWLWNTLGGRAVLDLNLDRRGGDEERTPLEELLLIPGVGVTLRRLYRVTDYGLVEAFQEAADAEERISARRSIERDELIEDFLLKTGGEPEEWEIEVLGEHLEALGLAYQRPGYLSRRVDQLQERRNGTTLDRLFAGVDSSSKRKAIAERMGVEVPHRFERPSDPQ